MLRLTKKLIFAIDAVVDIAYNASEEPVQSREIAERQRIPRRYLEQVLQHLVRAKILKGVRGPRGGYLLARERRRITLGQIARVVRELENMEDETKEEVTSDLANQVLHPIWSEMQEDLMVRLDKITIEDICRHATGLNIKRASDIKIDFTI